MNFSLGFALYALVSVVTLWLGLLWLWPRRKNTRSRGPLVKALAGAATVLLLFVPVGGVALWNRAFSFYPNPSLPMLGIVSAALWSRLFGLTVLKRADWRATWIFGAVAGSALYVRPLLFNSIDLYYWGWERELSAWVLGALAIAFLAWGSRFGVLLLAALLAYALSALESRNCWDYVIDPFYWLVSIGVLATRVVCLSLGRFLPTQAPARQALPAVKH